MWGVMKAMSWESMETSKMRVVTPETGIGQPQKFIPLFDLYADAFAFADGNTNLIAEFKTCE